MSKDYQKKYDEALELARAYYSDNCNEFLDTIFPELKESDDERIRKDLIGFIEDIINHGIKEAVAKHNYGDGKRWLAYLEKLKEPETTSASTMIPSCWEEEQKEQKPNIELIQRSWYMEGYHDREFGKEPKWIIKTGEGGPKHELNPRYGQHLVDEPKQEWTEEDEKMLVSIINDIKGYDAYVGTIATNFEAHKKRIAWLKDRLKSLRPQPKDEIYKGTDETYKLGKHHLAVKFMNYLNDNRPEGKMGLSNSECESIDKAFKENDWATIMKYVEKYKPHWKPTDEQMEVLLRTEGTLREMQDKRRAKVLAELYEQLKKLKEE